MSQRFLVIDDHPLMRDAITRALGSLAEAAVVETAATLAEALDKLSRQDRFDLALLDLQLPDAKGFSALQTLRREHPDCPVVVVSGEVDGPTILHCLELGAAGYIPKTLHAEAIMNALRLVAAGDSYIPMQAVAAERGVHEARLGQRRPYSFATLELEALGMHPRSTDPRELGLTDRQIEVLRLILRGLPNKLICRNLNLAEGTIKVHVSAVLRALGVRNRTQAIIAANRIGLQLSGTRADSALPDARSPATG